MGNGEKRCTKRELKKGKENIEENMRGSYIMNYSTRHCTMVV
jgi:hypothetical protein